MDDWQDFYNAHSAPNEVVEEVTKIKNFVDEATNKNSLVVLVTSGGTTVPLEQNTVRFVDNFSAGTRGSASAEYFLKNNYHVIFLYRIKSLKPFSRHYTTDSLLDNFEEVWDSSGKVSLKVNIHQENNIHGIYKERQKYKDKIIYVPFTTIAEYLHFLKECCQIIAPLGNRAMLYLAAAVSDFYIPPADLATHKISSDEPLTITLNLVPKILTPLVRHWVPEAFVVSFKLETREDILIARSKRALQKYGHKLVIANTLQTRKEMVILVDDKASMYITINHSDIKEGKEIEEKIIEELYERHTHFLNTI